MKVKKATSLLSLLLLLVSSCGREPEKLYFSALCKEVKDLKPEQIRYALSSINPGSISPTFHDFIYYSIGDTDEDKNKIVDFLENTTITKKDDPYASGGNSYSVEIFLEGGINIYLSSYMRGFGFYNDYYEWSDDLPSFSTFYAQQFLYHAVFDLSYYDGKSEKSFSSQNALYLYAFLFKETQEEIEPTYEGIYSANDLGKITPLTDTTFKLEVENEESKTYEIVNDYRFSNLLADLDGKGK